MISSCPKLYAIILLFTMCVPEQCTSLDLLVFLCFIKIVSECIYNDGCNSSAFIFSAM